MVAIFVFLGGGIGAVLRYAVSLGLAKWNTEQLPIATLTSNVIASLFVGVFVVLFKEKIAYSENCYAFLVVGVCGGFSTFSTFAKENLDLFERGNWAIGMLNIGVSVSLCLLAVYVGKKLV